MKRQKNFSYIPSIYKEIIFLMKRSNEWKWLETANPFYIYKSTHTKTPTFAWQSAADKCSFIFCLNPFLFIDGSNSAKSLFRLLLRYFGHIIVEFSNITPSEVVWTKEKIHLSTFRIITLQVFKSYLKCRKRKLLQIF